MTIDKLDDLLSDKKLTHELLISFTINNNTHQNIFSQKVYGCIKCSSVHVSLIDNTIVLDRNSISSFYSNLKTLPKDIDTSLSNKQYIPLQQVISIGLIEKHDLSVKNGSHVIVHYTKPTSISLGQGSFTFTLNERDYILGLISGSGDDRILFKNINSIVLNEFSYSKNQQVRARQEFPFNADSTEIYNIKRVYIREDIENVFGLVQVGDDVKFTSISGFEYEGTLNKIEKTEIFCIQNVTITFSKNGTIEKRKFPGSMNFNTGHVAFITIIKKGNGVVNNYTPVTTTINAPIRNYKQSTTKISTIGKSNKNTKKFSNRTSNNSKINKKPNETMKNNVNSKEWYLYQDEALCDDLIYTLINEEEEGLFEKIKTTIKNTPTLIYQLFEKYISLELEEKVHIDDNELLRNNITSIPNNTSVREYVKIFTAQRNIIQHKFSCVNMISIIDFWKYFIESFSLILDQIVKRVDKIMNNSNTSVIKKGACEQLLSFIGDCKRHNSDIVVLYNNLEMVTAQVINSYKTSNETHKKMFRKLANVELPSLNEIQKLSINGNITSLFSAAQRFITKYQSKNRNVINNRQDEIGEQSVKSPELNDEDSIQESIEITLDENIFSSDEMLKSNSENELIEDEQDEQDDEQDDEGDEEDEEDEQLETLEGQEEVNEPVEEEEVYEQVEDDEEEDEEILETMDYRSFKTEYIENISKDSLEEELFNEDPIDSNSTEMIIPVVESFTNNSNHQLNHCISNNLPTSENVKNLQTLNSKLNNFINYDYNIINNYTQPRVIEYNFKNPFGIYIHNDNIYITDRILNIIVRIINNNAQIIAGRSHNGFISGDKKLAINNELNGPSGICVSPGGEIYFSDTNNHRICKINLNGQLEVIAGDGKSGYNGDGQLAINASLKFPQGLCFVDGQVYIADTNNHRIRKIRMDGIIETVAGIGKRGFTNDNQLAFTAKLDSPTSIFYHEGEIYFSDSFNNRVRKIDNSGKLTTIVGGGVKSSAQVTETLAKNIMLNNPDNIYFNSRNEIFVSDTGNHRILKISPDLTVQHIFNLELKYPNGVFQNNQNQIFIVDTGNKRVLVFEN